MFYNRYKLYLLDWNIFTFLIYKYMSFFPAIFKTNQLFHYNGGCKLQNKPRWCSIKRTNACKLNISGFFYLRNIHDLTSSKAE
jgi:hypothetical protein